MSRILIAEDDKALSGVLKKKLELNGHEVAVAANGEEALDMLGKSKPYILLLDIVMPKVNGYEVLEHMHSDPALSSVPVIIISNSGQPVELDRAQSLGAVDYLVKADFEPSEVLEKINKYLTSSSVPGGAGTAPAAVPVPENNPEQNRSHSVLVVEDDKFLRDLLVLKLKREGFKVSEAVDGEEGLKKTRNEKPNIIVLDLIIPVKDGFAFLEEMKKDPETESIPVIVLSNLGQREDIERAKALGARDYMVKAQLTPLEVVERIKTILRESYI